MSTIGLTNDIPGVAATRAFVVPTVYDLIVGDK